MLYERSAQVGVRQTDDDDQSDGVHGILLWRRRSIHPAVSAVGGNVGMSAPKVLKGDCKNSEKMLKSAERRTRCVARSSSSPRAPPVCRRFKYRDVGTIALGRVADAI
jgi:hypothetical protein